MSAFHFCVNYTLYVRQVSGQKESWNTDPQNPETTMGDLIGTHWSAFQLFHSQQKHPFLLSPSFSETDETSGQLRGEIEGENRKLNYSIL